MANGIDRRRHSRLDVPAKLLVSKTMGALNLSESGMMIKCPKAIPVGRHLQLDLDLDGYRLAISAEVLRCTDARSIYHPGYEIGVRFEGHSVSEQLKLREFISTLS